jgi:multiple sugar transport system substrate-binding protein
MKTRMRRIVAAAAAAATIGITLVGCSSNSGSGSAGSGSSDSVTAALKKGGTLTYWAWATGSDKQVAAFEKAYPKVKVKLVNAGSSADEYTKLQNAIKAGSGAPDVAQIEYYAMPQFELTGGLADLTDYGFSSLKSKFSAGTWSAVTSGGKVYGLPQDSGPMALFYNKAVFDKYHLTVPKTWSEYVADAKKLHAANPKSYITSDNGDPGFATSMIWQAGGHPFKSNGKNVTINLKDPGTQKWTSTWNQLVENRLLSNTAGWTQDWFKQLGNGEIATLVTGAWMPGNLENNSKAASGDWRVAPMPTYDGGTAVTAQNGGSAQAVTAQSKNKDLAAGFLRWLNSSSTSTKLFGSLGNFPSTTADLNDPGFLGQKPAYFAKQPINTVLADASKHVAPNWQYLPFQVYANSIFADTVGQSYQKGTDLNAGLQAWQAALVKYGQSQGFTVSTK